MPSIRKDIGRAPVGGAINGTNGTLEGPEDLDVLVIGAGFSGCRLLYDLRRRGFKVKLVEAGSDLGGIWHWNTYPGARVDSQYPVYALSIPEVYETWSWTEQYPGYEELQRYFTHVGKVLGLKKDCIFNTKVTAAEWDKSADRWTVHCDDGKTFRTWAMIAAIGFAAKRHFPDWPGLDTFGGTLHHSSFWPRDVDYAGKKVAVIGTGATGVQIAQECAKTAGELTVFCRTPNIALPMRQGLLDPTQQEKDRLIMAETLRKRLTTDAGFHYSNRGFAMTTHSPEEREKLFEETWNAGGFRFLANAYNDILTNPESNRHAYNFWARKTRARIHDKEVADVVAPLEPPHPFGAKRPSLEQDYYDSFNKPNVHVVNCKRTPIKEFVKEGIVTSDGKLREFDIIALATGFDSITGGLRDIELTGVDNQTLAEKWKDGTYTYLGMTTPGFPNFFFTYGPQAPTAFSNGPSCVEPQCEWILELLTRMKVMGIKNVDCKKESAEEWRKLVNMQSGATLRHGTDSWYMGTNIPGKPREALNYGGGIPEYIRTISKVMNNGYDGFTLR